MAPVEKFTSEMAFDKASGWDVVFLEHVVKYPELCKSVGIVPKAGSNLFSFKLGDHEALFQAPEMKELKSRNFGTPVLYPSPGRMKDSQFTFNNEIFKFTPNWNEHFIHGFVHNIQWYFKKPKSSHRGAELETYLDFEPGEALYFLWPFHHRISQKYLLNASGLFITISVENFDKRPMPFGFALHPFFNIPGTKENTFLSAPAQKHMLLDGLMPTGEMESMDQFSPDIRSEQPLNILPLDDVFWGFGEGDVCWWEARDAGIRFTMEASDEFTHMVIYSQPPDCFCMENQTCSPDAHNLYANGYKKESNLLIVEPGEKKQMWIKYDLNYL